MVEVSIFTKEDLKRLEDGISQLQDWFQLIVTMTKLPDVVKIKDIAQIENVSSTILRGKCRYLLPRFGVSAFDEGYDRWPLQEYLEWKRIPPHKRKKMWKDLPVEERQRIVMGKHYGGRS
jgi:hypothetical protein